MHMLGFVRHITNDEICNELGRKLSLEPVARKKRNRSGLLK